MAILYTPTLRNGKLVKLNWPLTAYKYLNTISWPFNDEIPGWCYFLDKIYYIFATAVFFARNDAKIRYIRETIDNLDDVLTCAPTYLIMVEIHLRIFPMYFQKKQYRKFLETFFYDIYIDEDEEPQRYKIIQRQLVPTSIFTLAYCITLAVFISTPVYLVFFKGVREPLYKLIPPFNYKPLPIYIPLVMIDAWIGVLIAVALIGETNMIALLLTHLNGRYMLMREDLFLKTQKILQHPLKQTKVKRFQKLIEQTLDENVRLNAFAKEIQSEFSYRIFIIFVFTAGLLCVLGFKVYTSPSNSIHFVFWIIGKLQEIYVMGQTGDIITETTDNISLMYYESQWESIVAQSSNSADNVRLMKLIHMAILTNSKPFHFKGMNFFSVSLQTVVKIFRLAGSYFTCLISLRSI